MLKSNANVYNYVKVNVENFRDFSSEARSDLLAQEIERKLIVSALENAAYIIGQSADELGISNELLLQKMKTYKI